MKGISAIIPTYKGENYINKLLNSIKNQTIDNDLFEIIFIVNGELDKTPDIINEFKKNNPEINIILEYSDKGVCNARNHGIKIAKRDYIIFIDDDDFISEKYFEILLKYAKKDRIVIGTFFDIDENDNISESYLTPPLLRDSGIINNPYTDEYQGILMITTDKLIPSKYIKETDFNPILTNGVDISYFAQFYSKYDLEFYVVDKNEEAIYYRLWRDNSISRQSLSYEFNIDNRLKIINDINKSLKIAKGLEKISFIKSLTGGQVVKMNQYLNEYPEDLEKVLYEIASYNFEFFPYKYLHEKERLNEPNNQLIISYAFSPTNTTTSNMVAKRILTEKKNVDVICATLNNLDKDYSLNKIVDEFIINKFEIDLDFDTSWENIKEFTKKGLEKLGNYDKIYSRAYFPHSHFLALEYKLTHPATFWQAEFSDPLIYNFNKEFNSPAIEDVEYVNRINKHIKGEKIKTTDTINFICEYLTYLFADEIIFTNKNQYDVMMDLFPYKIDIKPTFKRHPTLDEKYYYIENTSYEIDDDCVNFAYFGVIFGNRILEDFLEGLEHIEGNYKLHLFTPNKTMFEQVLPKKVYENTYINPTVNYLEFLNLTTKFDVLLVEDTLTKNIFIKNPFLPSKISDYLGSKSDIWSVYENGSILSQIDVKYKSQINDLNSTISIINKIMDENNKIKDDYLRKRIIHLSNKIDELIQVAENEFKKEEEYLKEIDRLNQNLNNTFTNKIRKKFK